MKTTSILQMARGAIQERVDYEVQIVIDGCTYLTHYSRVVMVAK